MPVKIVVKIGEKQYNFLLHCEDNCRNIGDVKQFCFTRFPQLLTGNWADLKIFWNDQDGDEICVLADDDIQSFMLAADKDNRRLYVECTEAMLADASGCPTEATPDALASARRPVHHEFLCDTCTQEITGHRYRCLTCYDYHLCMTCESKYHHKDHIMLRIPLPLRSDTRSQRVLGKLEHYAAKLEFEPVGSDVGGKKIDTLDKKNVKKMREKPHSSSPCRTEKAQLGERISKSRNKGGHEPSTKTREHTKRDKTMKGARDSVREPKRSTTVEVAKDKIKTKPSKPLPCEHADEFQSSFCRKSRKHQSHCPFSLKVAVAPLLPSELQYCSGEVNEHICLGKTTNRDDHFPWIKISATKKASKVHADGQPKNAINVNTEPTSKESDSLVTSPTGSVVAGLVDAVLTHTSTELKKNLPTDEQLERVGDKLSTMHGQLGLGVKLPTPTETEVVQSGSNVPGDAGTLQEGEVSVAQESTNNHPEAAGKQLEAASQGSEPTLQTGSVAQEDNDECSSESSSPSTSMLTDDEEENGVEAVKPRTQPDHPSGTGEVAWILVDLPHDEKNENEDQPLKCTLPPTTRTESATPSAFVPNDQANGIEGSESDSEEDDPADTVRSILLQYTERRLEKLKKKNKIPKDGDLVPDDRINAIFEKLQNDLTKAKSAANAGENQQQMKDQNEDVAASVPTTSASEKKIVPAPSTTSALDSTDTAVATGYKIFSSRPYVDHAIHTMMTMGFSNDDGRLTNLLENLNGDIPRALDKLLTTQKGPAVEGRHF